MNNLLKIELPSDIENYCPKCGEPLKNWVMLDSKFLEAISPNSGIDGVFFKIMKTEPCDECGYIKKKVNKK